MKLELRVFFLGVLILLCGISCGQAVKETVRPVVPKPADGRLKRVVILPFADYTLAHSSYGHWRRNILVHEALQDEFYRAGFISAAREDVAEHLLDRGIIRPSKGSSNPVSSMSVQAELEEDWSDTMKKELQKVLNQSMATSTTDIESPASGKPISLDAEQILDIGNVFAADYIVRGRIVEFRLGNEDTFNPVKTSVLPFIFKSGKRAIFGITESDTYDAIDEGAIGGTLQEFETDTDSASGGPLTLDIDSEDMERIGDLAWGAGGFATGLLEKQGQVPEATVQLRMLIQDSRTGKVVWLNRAEVSVAPQTSYAEHDQYGLFSKAVRQAAKSLVDSFEKTLASGGVARIEREALMTPPKVTGPTGLGAGDADKAADQARRAAGEAKDSAQQAREAAWQANKASSEARKAVAEAKKASEKTEKVFDKIIAK